MPTGRASTFVPSRRRSGTSVTVAGDGDGAEVVGERQVAVGDDDVVEALAGDRRPAGVDGAVEAEPRAPQHLGAGGVGPRRDVVVVAGDERRQRPRRGDDPVGEPAGQLGALRRRRAARRGVPWPR